MRGCGARRCVSASAEEEARLAVSTKSRRQRAPPRPSSRRAYIALNAHVSAIGFADGPSPARLAAEPLPPPRFAPARAPCHAVPTPSAITAHKLYPTDESNFISRDGLSPVPNDADETLRRAPPGGPHRRGAVAIARPARLLPGAAVFAPSILKKSMPYVAFNQYSLFGPGPNRHEAKFKGKQQNMDMIAGQSKI